MLPGGLAILYTLAAQFHIEELWPAKGALRQGVVVDLHERLQGLQGGQRARAMHATPAVVGPAAAASCVDTAQAGARGLRWR